MSPARGVDRNRVVEVCPDAERVSDALPYARFGQFSETQAVASFGKQTVNGNHGCEEGVHPAHHSDVLPVAVFEQGVFLEAERPCLDAGNLCEPLLRYRIGVEYLAARRRYEDIRVERFIHVADQSLEAVEHRQQDHHCHDRNGNCHRTHPRNDIDHRV